MKGRAVKLRARVAPQAAKGARRPKRRAAKVDARQARGARIPAEKLREAARGRDAGGAGTFDLEAQAPDFDVAADREATGTATSEARAPARKDGGRDEPERAALATIAAARPGPPPHRAELETMFGPVARGVAAVSGPEVEAALDALGAEAAAAEGRVALRKGAPLSVIAHEVAHVLQGAGAASVANHGAAEAEARDVEAAAEAAARANEAPGPIALRETLAPGAAALRSLDDMEAEAQVEAAGDRRGRVESFQQGMEAPAATTDEAGEARQAEAEKPAEAAEEAAAEAEGDVLGEGADLGADVAEEPAPTFQPPAAPEIEVDEEAAKAAAEEAEAELAAADDADALMESFADAPPSVKALHHDKLDGETQRLSAEEQETFDAEMPNFDAEMSGEDSLGEPKPIVTPEAGGEEGPAAGEGEVAKAKVDLTPDPEKTSINQKIKDFLARFFGFGDASSLGKTFSKVSTENKVDTSAGTRPKVPREGATDPQQIKDADEKTRAEAEGKRREAAQAVVEGRGPEQAKLKALKEENRLEPRAAPEIAETANAEGPDAFRERSLDPTVTALFDAEHGEAMTQSLAEAKTEARAAVGGRDAGRDAEVQKAEDERDRLNQEADKEQRDKVKEQRDAIQTARQTAVDDQQQAVRDMEADADTKRKDTQTEIDTKVFETETQVETDYSNAEKDAEGKVEDGEKKAEDEKKKREREAENQSWWDRAKNWVAEQFDKLTKFINDVFDAVRKAVKDLIDKVKKAVVELIDKAANAIKGAIRAFGEALKKGVNALLAEHFPAAAKALNDAIDSGVELAEKAVDAAADTLKKGITALLDALAKGLDAILAAYQAAINAALALAKAAITGDWGEIFKMILTPILKVLGIDPQAFYDMIAKALDALGDIIDDPIGFLKNLVNAVTSGVSKFATNLFIYLQKGIIGWLTGALGGGITIPDKWDLWGVLDLARQILGLTAQLIRKVAVRILGEKAVERIEFFMDYAKELITRGWKALWEKIMADLGALKDLVLEEIKSFLVTRVVIAAVTWIASLFNPVGALIKLVFTIWNFLMFLKDQIARIIEVLKTVTNALADIVAGVIEPAAKKVEEVLGNAVPIIIDLLARLLGLGNVAGRVKRIIAGVRQKIEDAIVKLIRKVLAKFIGKGRAKGTAEKEEDAAAPGQLMKPLPFAGAGQSHTLYIKRQGRKAAVTMRSEERPVETWLKSLRTPEGVKAAIAAGRSTREIDDAEAQELSDKLKPIVAEALAAEAKAEREGTEEVVEKASGRDDAANDAEVAEAAQKLKAGLVKALETLKLGKTLAAGSVLDPMIRRIVHPALVERFKVAVEKWTPEQIAAIETEADLISAFLKQKHRSWISPMKAEDDGVLRIPALNVKTLAGIKKMAEELAAKDAKADVLVDALTELSDAEYAARYFLPEFNKSPDNDRVARLLLESPDLSGLEAYYEASAKETFSRLGDVTKGPDKEFKDDVAGAPITAIQKMKDAAEGKSKTYTSYKNEADPGQGKRTGDFVGMISSDKASYRYERNRAHLSDRIRAVKPNQHEWLQGALAAKVIEATAKQITAAGGPGAVKAGGGLKLMIDFQNEVRTPTRDLLFKPGASADGYTIPKLEIEYVAPEHVKALKDKRPVSPPDLTKWYGGTTPPQVEVVQAHAGGLRGRRVRGGKLEWTNLQAASPGWHKALRSVVAKNAEDDSLLEIREFKEIREGILNFVDATIWRGAAPVGTVAGKHFDFYAITGPEREVTFSQLKDYAAKTYDNTYNELSKRMAKFG